MSFLGDLSTLVKAGFTFDQIKELQQVDKMPIAEKATETKETSKETIDYKKKFEEAEAKLKELQIEATKEDISAEDLKIDEVIKGIANRLR